MLAMVCIGLTVGCQDDIDMSNRYTFTEETVASYLKKHENYSQYYKLLDEVNISSRSQSTVLQLMSARGHYTVFAPNNQAIQEYLDTLCSKGIISQASWDGFRDEQQLDSIRKVIVFNSIIDGGDEVDAYQTSGFPEDTKEFNLANMNERKLTVNYGNNPDSLYVNGTKDDAGNVLGGSLIDLRNRDIIATNGYIHEVHTVIAPSNETLADIMKTYIETNEVGFIVTAKILEACGLFDTLSKVKDEVYEQLYLSQAVTDLPNHPSFGRPGYLPEHRKYGFTIFTETDEFWEATLGKPVSQITPEDIQAWVVQQGFYPNALDNTDYKDEKNVLNQFITYHILPMRLPVDKLVIHYNEMGYNYKTSTSFTVPTYELYTTMGERRLLKLYQCGKAYSCEGSGEIFINRFPELDNGRHGKMKEVSCSAANRGFVVNTEKCQNVLNGYIYPIDGVLAYDETTRTNLQKQRLRFDVSSMFPEWMNNDIRADRVGANKNMCVGMPNDNVYQYCENLNIAEGSQFYYLLGLGLNWKNWQGDEVNVVGRYEMTFKLPPVPKEGTYEIRYAVQTESQLRGMCQVYFGESKENLAAMGIPLDLRMGGTQRKTSAGTFESIVGWVLDEQEDDDYNAEIDKKMRNNGFMKGPQLYAFTPGGNAYARGDANTIRRIIVREYMYPEKTYYLKFKSVLDDEKKEFYMDYLELCAKEVYDNPQTPEDIW